MIKKQDIDALKSAGEAIENILVGQGTSDPIILPDGQNLSDPVAQLVEKVEILANQYREGFDFIMGLSKGNLDQAPPRNNQFVAYFKQLHSDLLHLRWQTQQIAHGDYDQQVSFMGDFSDSFNKMIESLRQKQVLEDELIERERKLQETAAELKKVIEMKDKLFSIIAHDLRGPIGNTGNLIKLILDGDIKDPAEIQRALRMVYTSSESTFGLLENLLAWSDSSRQELPYNPGKFPIKPIFDDIIDLFRSSLEVKELRISSQVDSTLTAFFDPAMIRTVIRNLVNNAVKFTPGGGSILLSASKSGDHIEVKVKDTGIGIPPEIADSLFNPSTTTIRHGTNHEKGHGLGLTLCHEMVQRNGGILRVESTEGRGTTFLFDLKLG